MLVTIPDVLDQQRLDYIRSILDNTPFIDGKLSAGMAAQRVNQNEELAADAQQLEQLNNLVMGNLIKHPLYQAAALPAKIAAPYYARYQPGMAYGDHVDDAIMGPAQGRYRSDVSVTVFLNTPEEYDGGELVIRTSFGSQSIKLAAGQAVVYPSSSLHQVTEVSRGTRLVAVSWAQSLIRDPARRELLYGLNQARESLLQQRPDDDETRQVDIAYSNLFRMWAEI